MELCATVDAVALLDSPEGRIVRLHQHLFAPGFGEWLEANYGIWEDFSAEACTLRALGWKHYSARAIVHYLRHQTALREVGGEFKINDHVSPDLARLWMLCGQGRDKFFETRISAHSTKRAA